MFGPRQAGILALLVSAAAIADPGSTTASARDFREATLELVHDGRFDDADRVIGEAVRKDGRDAERAFFEAFVTYWRLLYDDDNLELQGRFDKQLNTAISLAEHELDNDPADGAAALWLGSSHLLLAQLRAAQRKPLKAAFEAKKAKKMLEAAVAGDSPPEDSDFGLGTYQYYADILPAIIKGLRFLLFIPPGDREEGLERLARAADHSRYFALEARMLLAAIYANSHERMYDEALAEEEIALARYPDTIAVLHGAARLELGIGRPGRALSFLSKALQKIENQSGTSNGVIGTLQHYAARAEGLRYRPDRALEHLRPMLENPSEMPSYLHDDVYRRALLYGDLTAKDPEWLARVEIPDTIPRESDPAELRRLRHAANSLVAAREGLEMEREGRLADSATALESLANESKDDPVLALLAGRAFVRIGHGKKATPYLTVATGSETLPRGWLSRARLLAGMAADLAGARSDALVWYRLTVEDRRFPAKDAAYLYESRPCGESDLPAGLSPVRTRITAPRASSDRGAKGP